MHKIGVRHPQAKVTLEDSMSKQVFHVGVDVGKEELWAAVEGHRPRRFAHCTSGIRLRGLLRNEPF
jgi:hypothetical protein